jgi:hypothetical protein
MKIVVRGLVALALLIVGNAAHGFIFTATSPGDDTEKTLSASATFTISDLKLVIISSNTASNDLVKSAEIRQTEPEIKRAEAATRGMRAWQPQPKKDGNGGTQVARRADEGETYG